MVGGFILILIMFDIDGTLVSSKKINEICFINSIKETFNLNDFNTNWATYKNMTEISILQEIVFKNKNRRMYKYEMYKFINIFRKKIKQCLLENSQSFKEIEGTHITVLLEKK